MSIPEVKGGKVMTDFRGNILDLDCSREAERISEFIKKWVLSMRREGAVIGLSGGIDSALASELCVRALGQERVLGLILPERESNPVSLEYALKHARKLGIRTEVIDITPALAGFGAYEKRDAVVREFAPEYREGFKFKITLPPDLLARDAFNFFTLTISDGKAPVKAVRLNKDALNGIVAATDVKHRMRMAHLYYSAEKMNYLVCGTTNRSEVIQGFFVKYGDGGVDIEPLAHLYKTQAFQLSEHLGVIPEILSRAPSPDTFSIPVSDEEFYFRMPYDKLDLLLYAWEHQIPINETGRVMGLTEEQVMRAFRDFASKHAATEYLRIPPPTMSDEGS
jgi:NAD+ synthase